MIKLKTIGLIGGMSWESTVTYYTELNRQINQQLGGLHSAKLILASVDFAEIEKCQSENNWQKSGEILGGHALQLEQAGADFILICTNTMHKVADQIKTYISIPILHIADATISALEQHAFTKVGLLGTRYTMTQNFYKERIIAQGIEVVIPNDAAIEKINDIIFNELVLGEINPQSKATYLEIISSLQADGVEGIILGCTEIGLLIQQTDSELPLFDTTLIHAKMAAKKALDN